MIDVAMLAVPVGMYERQFKPAFRELDVTSDIRERWGDTAHINMRMSRALEDIARVYDRIHGFISARTDMRVPAFTALKRARYKNDPACVLTRCDRGNCEVMCAADIWSTPLYWRDAPSVEIDCDDIEFLLAGTGAGKPVFVRPDGKAQGHVLHLIEAYGTLARDYCVEAGMPHWTGKRSAFFFDGERIVNGTIQPERFSRELSRYICQWQ